MRRGYDWRKHLRGGSRGRSYSGGNRGGRNGGYRGRGGGGSGGYRGRGGGGGGDGSNPPNMPMNKMASEAQLLDTLTSIDRKGYGAYKAILGSYHLQNGYMLFVDHVQSDPYASPSRIRIRVPMNLAGFPQDAYRSPIYGNNSNVPLHCDIRTVALCDFLGRMFYDVCQGGGYDKVAGGGGWSGGKGGDLRMMKHSQHVLQRTAVVIGGNGDNVYVEARCGVGLPARGRSIMGEWCAGILTHNLVSVAENSMVLSALDSAAMWNHIRCVEDQQVLRDSLSENGLVGFVRNGAILPRFSGDDDRPMSSDKAVPFRSPKSMEVTLNTPNSGAVSGMGIKKGVTLIVGGGFHGKSTLLEALELGVYNHIPGDGREFVAMERSGVKIRAEDGRNISGVDISPFINNLPFGKDTTNFESADGSGSTSQAANIMEALEAGSRTLLIDEDTSATNFMIRDQRMQVLVSGDKEPISPFVNKVKALHNDHQCSTVLVIGGCGDYFNVANQVIMMDSYQPLDVTERANEVAQQYPIQVLSEHEVFGSVTHRKLLPESFRSMQNLKVRCRSVSLIEYGQQKLDLTCVEQLVEQGQTKAIQDIITLVGSSLVQKHMSLAQLLDELDTLFDSQGLDEISHRFSGDYSRPRRFEIAAALNRLRFLKFNTI